MLDVDEIKGPQCLGPRNAESSAKAQKSLLFYFFDPNIFFKLEYDIFAGVSSYGHITVKAPHPIRTAKLSTVELDQYFGRGLQGNLQCCMAFYFFVFAQTEKK